jgi:hypothetical protein
MYAKLFSRIAQSSLMEEDIETRYCFMMLLAIADSGGDVIGTDVALARTVNLPLDTFKRCIVALMAPDPDSNSQVNEGRRIMPSESGRGYLLVNYATYRSIKTAEEKKAYMREYMQRRRKLLKDKDVTAVNVCKTALSDVTHAEGEGEADREEEAFQPKEHTAPAAHKKRGYAIPECFAGVDGFTDALQGWIDSRKQLRKPATDHAVQLMLGKLSQKPSRAIAALNKCILSGWQGFEWAWMDGDNRNGATLSPFDTQGGKRLMQ